AEDREEHLRPEARRAVELERVVVVEAVPGVGGVGEEVRRERELRRLDGHEAGLHGVLVQDAPADALAVEDGGDGERGVAAHEDDVLPVALERALGLERRAADEVALELDVVARERADVAEVAGEVEREAAGDGGDPPRRELLLVVLDEAGDRWGDLGREEEAGADA